MPELRCLIRWYRPNAIPRGDNMLTRMHFRFVFDFARPPSANHRKVYVRNLRTWAARKVTKGVREVQPSRLRWANGWRILVVDLVLEYA